MSILLIQVYGSNQKWDYGRKKTNKDIQAKINKERDHWEKVI